MARLRADFKAKLPSRLTTLRQDFDEALQAGEHKIVRQCLTRMREETHKLSGSAGVYGFPEVSVLAREFENASTQIMSEGEAGLTRAKLVEIEPLIHSLCEMEILTAVPFDDCGVFEEIASPTPKDKFHPGSILLIDDDQEFASSLKAQLAIFGYKMTWEDRPEKLAEHLKSEQPAAIIMDVVFPGNTDAGFVIIDELRATGIISCPVIFLSQRDDIAARLGAHRAGCHDYLVKSLDRSEMVSSIVNKVFGINPQAYRVMVVDDDKEISAHYKTLLEGAGFDVHTINEPMLALDGIRDFNPDAILLDVHMPGCSGIELAAVLRQDSRLIHIPVIFLTSDSDDDRKLMAVQSGADEFLLKSASDTYIIATLSARSQKSRELKRKIEKLGRSENHFRTLAHGAADAIVSIDKKGLVVQWNQGAEDILGYNEEDILGLSIELLFPPLLYGKTLDRLLAPQSDGETTKNQIPPFEAHILTASKGEIPIDISITNWDAGGQWNCTAIIRDISERKNSEQVLEKRIFHATRELNAKSQSLEDALRKEKHLNQMQRQFVSMASHEFRTPLAIIDSTAQRLLNIMVRSGTMASPEGKQVLDNKVSKIRYAIKRLTSLIESTLAAENIDSGKMELNTGTCNLHSLIWEICERQQEISSAYNITADLEGLPFQFMADSGKLDQVFTNLLSNAVKYSPDGKNIEVCGGQKDGNAVISVTDHGLGIAKSEQAKIFDRFYRASSSVGIVGTGIGLYLVKEFVSLHSGSVSVDSIEGEGTTITVRIPMNLQAELINADMTN